MILDFRTYITEKFDPKKDLRGVLKETDRHRFRKLLKNNILIFKFKKRDGSIRRAKGTLNSKYLPELKGGSPRPEHQMVYFDLEKDHWRSFRSYSFIKILNIKPISGTPSPKKHKEEEDEEETTKKPITKKVEKEEKEEVKKKEVEKKELHKEHEEEPKKVHKEEEHEESEEPKEEREEKKEIKKEPKKEVKKSKKDDEPDDEEDEIKDKDEDEKD